MNYLAHLHLSCSDEFLLMGNFMADMLSHKETKKLPSDYKKGIQLHKVIDTFTDGNPEVKLVNQKLHPYVGKYAPVASDILFDYFLAKNWTVYHHLSLEDFMKKTYHTIERYITVAPPATQELIKKMIHDNFLAKYTNKEGLYFVFEKMNKRAKFEVDFKEALELLDSEENEVETLFKEFYDKLISEVNIFCSC